MIGRVTAVLSGRRSGDTRAARNGDRRVTFLVLQGDRNPPVRDKLFDILETHQLITK